MPRYPNLFLVGAPKCGTSSLFDALRQHPEIFAAVVKEPHHFGSDLGMRRRLSLEHYLDLYATWGEERYALDASVFYLSSTRAAQEIHSARSDSQIVLCLRDPVEGVASLHHHMHSTGDEPCASLRQALDLEPARARGEHVPDIRHPHALQYRDVYRYSEQISRYFDAFGRERVHVVLLEDLAHDAVTTVGRVIHALGLDPFEVDPALRNESRQVRSATLRQAVKRPPPAVRRAGRTLLRTSAARRRVRAAVLDLDARHNTIAKRRAPTPADVRAMLEVEFAAEIEATEALLGIDLSRWRPEARSG